MSLSDFSLYFYVLTIRRRNYYSSHIRHSDANSICLSLQFFIFLIFKFLGIFSVWMIPRAHSTPWWWRASLLIGPLLPCHSLPAENTQILILFQAKYFVTNTFKLLQKRRQNILPSAGKKNVQSVSPVQENSWKITFKHSIYVKS